MYILPHLQCGILEIHTALPVTSSSADPRLVLTPESYLTLVEKINYGDLFRKVDPELFPPETHDSPPKRIESPHSGS